MALNYKNKIFIVGSQTLADEFGEGLFSTNICLNFEYAVYQAAKANFDAAVIDEATVKSFAPDVGEWLRDFKEKCVSLPIILCNSKPENELDYIKEGIQEVLTTEQKKGSLPDIVLRAIEREKYLQKRINPAAENKPVIERRNKARWQTPEIYAVGASILDRLPMGVLLVGQDANVRLMNARARKIVSNSDGLYVDRAGICRANSPEDTLSLHDLIKTTAADQAGDSDFAIMLERSDERPPLSVLVTPVGNKPSEDGSDNKNPSAGAALFISDPEEEIKISTEVLQNLYGLSKTEAKLVMGLVTGRSFQELASDMNISHHTVRSHFKKIFAKTNVGRQAELVKTILTGPAAIRG